MILPKLFISNMERKNKIPITRTRGWYNESDFQFDVEIARQIIEEDANFTVVLYRVDLANTNSDDIYGESNPNEVRYFPPVELKVLVNLIPTENKSYNTNGSIRYQQYGNLEFTILLRQLTEKNVDIAYGDVIAYADTETNMKYFSVFNNDKIPSSNDHTIYGYKGYYRRIECVSIDPNEFNGI